MKRIMIGSLMHETNMFNPFPTRLEEFKMRELFYGDEILAKRRNTNTEIGGFIDMLEKNRIAIVPSVASNAMASGIVTNKALETILGAILDTLDRNYVDGVLLALHGAMVTEDHEDGDGYILEQIRKKVGSNIPLVVTLDLHATLTPLMISNIDALTIYRTYPHMDMAERGREAASIIMRIMNGEVKPVIALSKPVSYIGRGR